MWNIIITLNTVGYGDYFPKSHCGRLIVLLTAFWGVFYTSLFIVACDKIFKFTDSEEKAY